MYAIIACGVFEREIELLRPDLGFAFNAHYLPAGLHVSFEALGDALKEELERCEAEGAEGIIVAFGRCHPGIEEMLRPHRAALIDCQNCVDALITARAVQERAKKGLFFYLSPGWLDAWKEIFSSLNWGLEEARMAMGSFRGSIYMDTLKDAEDREDALLEFFDFTNLPFEVIPVDLGHFKSLITKARESLEV